MPAQRVCRICRSSYCVCDVKVCNCARCGKELTSNRRAFLDVVLRQLRGDRQVRPLELLAGRDADRPYCERCIPIERDHTEVAMHFHSCRTPRQRAKMGSAYC